MRILILLIIGLTGCSYDMNPVDNSRSNQINLVCIEGYLYTMQGTDYNNILTPVLNDSGECCTCR